jgi:surface protein
MSYPSGSELSAPVVVPNLARTNGDIRVAVNKWCENPIEAEAIYGHISFWDVSTVKRMNLLFHRKGSFNEDLSRWNVSACIDMTYMFGYASSFNSDLSEWSTGNVKFMIGMFYDASSFTSDLSEWSTGKVESMEGMFYDASSFNSDLSEWSTGKVKSMEGMFNGASSFNSDLSEWIVMKGTNVGNMFRSCPCDDFRSVWKKRRQIQKAKDECWERRLPWMVAIAPYIRGEVTEAAIQMVFDMDGLIEFITSFM